MLLSLEKVFSFQSECPQDISISHRSMSRFCLEKATILQSSKNLWVDSLQVEISATDAISLGVKAPIRESGNIAGSAPIAIIGPKGAVYLNEGCIVAKRHIHMAPKDAMAAGVHDGDIVSVKADNERGTIFNNVQIRVDDSFTLEMHIDTDEANAAQIKSGDTVRIVSC